MIGNHDIVLKGGSLSKTYLPFGQKFVRKEVSLNADREYGYTRWYSQLKKIQRINNWRYGIFPELLGVGVDDAGNAYYDMAYLQGFTDVKTLFATSVSDEQVILINKSLWKALQSFHAPSRENKSSSPALYFREEVLKKLQHANTNPDFGKFFNYGSYTYQNQNVDGIEKYIDKLQAYFDSYQLLTEEVIHGNPTLENIMYSKDNRLIVFIDPYEESILDSKFLDYAQILQCSRSYYGHHNDNTTKQTVGNAVLSMIIISQSLIDFNKLIEDELKFMCTQEQLRFVDILEATQFIRMLPFKCIAGDIIGAKFFYAHACFLLKRLFE